jgi:hypothetical protein
MPAILHRETKSYDDIAAIVSETWEEVGKPDGLEVSLFNGDWQTFTRMFDLILKNPGEFEYCIPFPGEWHWNWHILQAIFKIWGDYILKPLSLVLEYKSLDLKCKNFHYGEDFMEVITIALVDLMRELRELHPDMTFIGIMHHYKANSHVYELVYLYVWHICPYWHTRAALKSANSAVIDKYWRYWLHAFIACRKSNYAIMTMRFLWMLRFLNDDLLKIIADYRVYSFTGTKDTGILMDSLNELVRITHTTLTYAH